MQTPLVAAEQLSQAPVQALPQQTPFTQKLLMQSEEELQPWPFGVVPFAVQTPPLNWPWQLKPGAQPVGPPLPPNGGGGVQDVGQAVWLPSQR